MVTKDKSASGVRGPQPRVGNISQLNSIADGAKIGDKYYRAMRLD